MTVSRRAIRSVREPFAERLRLLRRRRRLTQRRLGQRADLSVRTIANLETSVAATTLDNLSRLARALGVPLSSLLHGVPPLRKAR